MRSPDEATRDAIPERGHREMRAGDAAPQGGLPGGGALAQLMSH